MPVISQINIDSQSPPDINKNPRMAELLLSRLTDKDPRVLAETYRRLAACNKQTVVPALLPLLGSKNAGLAKAGLALLRYFAPIDYNILLALATRGQAAALELLAYHKPMPAGRRLARKELKGEDRELCLAAMVCLKRWEAKELAPLLLPLLEKDALLAKAAIDTLASLAYVPALDRLAGLLWHPQLGPAADQAVKSIIKQIPPQKPPLNNSALLLYFFNAHQVWPLPDKQAAQCLHLAIRQALNTQNAALIGQALLCLMHTDPRPYAAELLGLIENNSHGLKKQLTEIMLGLGAQKIIARHLNHAGMLALAAACLRDNPAGAQAMADIILWLGQHKTGFSTLKQLLQSDDARQRGQAAMTMGRLKMKQGTAYLAQALYHDPRLKVAWAAAGALYNLQCGQAVKALAAGLSHPRPVIRCVCLHYLAQGGNLRPWLEQLASDPHPRPRHHLLRAIACHKRLDWYEPVADALRNDREHKIRLFCIELDIAWNMPGYGKRLMRAVLDRQESGRAIKLLPETAQGIEVLQTLLLHSNAGKRAAALHSLPHGYEMLAFNLLKDNNPIVRGKAVATLNRWRG